MIPSCKMTIKTGVFQHHYSTQWLIIGAGTPVAGVLSIVLVATSAVATGEDAMGPIREYCGTEGHATVHGQVFTRKGRSSVHGRPSPYQRMLSHFWASQHSFVARWQAMELFNSASGGLILQNNIAAFVNPINNMPMYAFNLTSLPLGGSIEKLNPGTTPGNVVTFPCYALEKVAGTGSTSEYNWQYVNSINDAGNTGWRIEWDSVGGQRPVPYVNKYFVDWANVQLAFRGALKRPVKVHVALAQFRNNAGPRRYYYDGTDAVAYDTDASVEEKAANCAVWDHFWANKISNPIRTSKAPETTPAGEVIKFLKHKSFVLGQSTNINEDTLPVQLIHKDFIHIDKLMRCPDLYYPAWYSSAVVGDNLTNSAFEYVNVQDGNLDIHSTVNVFPERTQDIWLLVYADVFDQSKNGAPPDGFTLPDLFPSFDINLRAKFSYNL